MALRTSDHLRTHLSVFEAEYPIQKGYIARLLIVDGRSVRDVLDEVRSIVQAAEPEKHLHEPSFTTNVYALKRLIIAKSSFLTAEWPSLIRLFIQPFPLTFKKMPVVPDSLQPEHKPCHGMELSETSVYVTNGQLEDKQGKAACDKDEEVDALEDIFLDSEPSYICDDVSPNSPSHNSHTCADVEENRTVVYNSHSSVCVGENVLSDRTSNHQVITSENIKEEMCYTEDVISGEKNKQTHKEATESASITDFQAMDAGVKNGCNENSEDLHQGYNILLQQGLSACKKTPDCPQNYVNIIFCSRKYLNEILVTNSKTNHVASQKSDQPSVLFSDKPSVLHKNQSTVLQPDQLSAVQFYKCKFCYSGFLLNSSLKEHRLVQRGILPHICSNCGHAFRLGTVLMKHTNEQTEKKADKSAQFDEKFCIDGTFQWHLFLQEYRIKHSKKQSYKCDDCRREFAIKSLLKLHIITHTGEKPYMCDVCGHQFAAASYLKKHKRLHTGEKPYQCEVCGLGFAMNYHLKIHARKHSGEKPYKCDICDHRFTIASCLAKHRIKHTGKVPYKCDVCGRGCASNTSLKKHKMIHTGEKPYKCYVCGRGYTTKSYLKLHKIWHTGEKPCKCLICGKSYLVKSALNVHKRVHTKERPYKCDVCGATFATSSSFKTHKIIHTGEKPYECDICGFRVNRKGNLRLHKKVHKA